MAKESPAPLVGAEALVSLNKDAKISLRRCLLAAASVLLGGSLTVFAVFLYFDSFRNETELYMRYDRGGATILIRVSDGTFGVYIEHHPPPLPWLHFNHHPHWYL